MMTEIKTDEELAVVFSLPKAAIYFRVDWSGPEREARARVRSILSELGTTAKLFFMDCTDQPEPLLPKWTSLVDESTLARTRRLFDGGWVALAFLRDGHVEEIIEYPMKLEREQLKQALSRYCIQTP
ncbi:MAG: hypothetical protein IT226_06110 [Flavobacteriales bacterium]|nr:hypothetical protein [Flavobacteriales bacterium]